VVEEGNGDLIDTKDHVYYRHETRHENGQLVDFSEKRRAVEKFDMGDPLYHDFYKIVLKTMRKGEVAWVKFTKAYHRGIYHQAPHYMAKTDEEKKELGSDIWIKLAINKLFRNPVCEDPNTY
jgi:hypothetical protein